MRHIKSTTAAILTATALLNAPAAQASPETDFLTTLNSAGILVYDANLAVDTGWAICNAMNDYRGDYVAEAFYQTTGTDIPDRATAAVWVVAAATTLCPWHFHPERAATREYLPPAADVPISGGMGGKVGA